MLDYTPNQDHKAARKAGTIFFTFMGTSNLVAWCSILTALDLFVMQFPKYDPAFYFTIVYFCATNMFSVLVHIIAKYVSENKRIIIGFLGQVVTSITLLFITLVMPNAIGYALVLINLFVLAAFNSIAQNTSFAYAASIDSEYIVALVSGTGISGLVTAFLRVFFLAFFGDTDGIIPGTICYFATSTAIIIITVIMYIPFKKMDYMLKPLPIDKGNTESLLKSNHDDTLSLESCDQNQSAFELEQNLIKKEKTGLRQLFKNAVRVYASVQPLPIFLLFALFVTFCVFPGVTLKKQFHTIALQKAWGPTLFITVFNVGDFVGKYLVQLGYGVYRVGNFLLFSRVAHIAIFILIAKYPENIIFGADWFGFINILMFSITNGYSISLYMGEAGNRASEKDKETVSFIMTSHLFMGIFSGSLAALAFNLI